MTPSNLPMTGEQPAAALGSVAEAFSLVRRTLSSLTDSAARGPSRLPGWTRGHVVTHLARNADGNAFILAGAAFGRRWPQYPGGPEQRAADIEAGAHRDAAALLDDLDAAQQRFDDAAQHVAGEHWRIPVATSSPGTYTVAEVPASRRRELLVHLVDLDLGVAPVDLPEDFLASQRDWLAEHRTRETWREAPW